MHFGQLSKKQEKQAIKLHKECGALYVEIYQYLVVTKEVDEFCWYHERDRDTIPGASVVMCVGNLGLKGWKNNG